MTHEQGTTAEPREPSRALTAWGLGLAIVSVLMAFWANGLFAVALSVAAIALSVLGAVRNPSTRTIASVAAVIAAVGGAIAIW